MTEEQEREWKSIREEVGSPASLPSPLGKITMSESTYFAADADLRALRARVAELEGAILYAVLEGGKG